MSLLAVRGITVAYGRMPALRDISLEIEAGEMLAVLGVNGAGKTTLLRAVCGLEPLQAGSVELSGRRVSGKPAWRAARAGIGAVLENARVFGEQSVADNLALGRLHAKNQASAQRIETELLEKLPVLAEKMATLAASLSGGERAQLAIAQALVASPCLLVLDEPSVGLAPLVVRRLYEILDEQRKADNGPAILVAEQLVDIVLRVADRGVVLDGGRIVLADSAANLRADNALTTAYLGKSTSR